MLECQAVLDLGDLGKHVSAKLPRRVPTPCIGVCSTGLGDEVCRGCKRFAHEVIDWNAYTEEQKRVIDQRLEDFLGQVVANKLTVFDPDLLELQLQLQQIRYSAHRSPLVWAFELLRAGASQIDDPADFGLRLRPAFERRPLTQLREDIDREFYLLSEAHYDRYMRAGALRDEVS